MGAQGFHGNPYDGHTLKASLKQAGKIIKKILCGDVFVDKGYRGHDYDGPAEVHVAGRKKRSTTLKKWMRRRSAIEATIGHLKQSSRLDRKTLKRKVGDCINPILSACGWNLHLILAALRKRRAFFGLFQSIRRWIMGDCTAYDIPDQTPIPNIVFAD